MDTLTLESPAKINLHLRVGDVDAAGFHPLWSWMVRIGLSDTLRFERRATGGVRLTCDDPTLPVDATNLVVRAATMIAPDASLAIHLTKRIPAGAGLGGGSGNAATTLRAVNGLLRLGHAPGALHAMAATLGSDVPFFLGPSSAVATGRGERLAPAPLPAVAQVALLVLPPFGISTAAAYRALDRLRPAVPADALAPADVIAWAALPAAALMGRLANDLEMAAFGLDPRLGALRADIERRLGRIVRMSGSGSTLFTLYDTPGDAAAAAESLGETGVRSVAVALGGPAGFSG